MGEAKAAKTEKIKSAFLGAACILAASSLLVCSKSAADGARNGLVLCAESIIPSLFVFMIISVFICRSSASKAVSALFYPITKYVLKLEPKLGCVVAMSMIGGYPVGASLLSDMVKSGETDSKTASRMMWFCSNAAPAFVITAVGINMFGSLSLGVILLVSHLLSSLIIGAFVGRALGKSVLPREFKRKTVKKSSGDIFVESVSSAVNSIFAICAYVVLFSTLLGIINGSETADLLTDMLSKFIGADKDALYGVLCGFFEVTCACDAIAKAGVWLLPIASFFISFSGLSVILQVKHIFRGTGVKLTGYVISRLLCGILSAVITKILVYLFPSALSVGGALDNPVISQSAGTFYHSLCVVLICCAFLFSISKSDART